MFCKCVKVSHIEQEKIISENCLKGLLNEAGFLFMGSWNPILVTYVEI